MLFSRHSLTILSLVLGILGSLYLSYDLLGKPGGVLRRIILGISISAFGGLFGTITALITAPFWDTFIGVAGIVSGFIIGFSYFPTDQELSATRSWVKNIKPALLTKRALSYFGIYSIIASFIGTAIVLVKLHRLDIAIAIFFTIMIFCLVFIAFITIVTSTFFNFYIYLSRFTSSLTERRLGAIGALLTLVAFAIQLCLAIFD